jgi:hypothetical protein
MSKNKDLCVSCKNYNKSYCRIEDNGEYKHSKSAGNNFITEIINCSYYEKKVSKRGVSNPRLGAFRTHNEYYIDEKYYE